MRVLAGRLCDYILTTYGDMAWVTPATFANALRIVAELPDDATPLQFELFAKRYARVDVNVAPKTMVGFNYSDNDTLVIETGRGRSVEERNLTIPHEFGELLRNAVNEELISRGLQPLEWEDRAWDKMAVEIVSPIASFRASARQNGIDLIDLARPLSFEAVVQHVKAAFDDDVPLFAVYAKNAGTWERGRGFRSTAWQIAAASWTKRWLRCGYAGGREVLVLPRSKTPLGEGSILDDVRSRGRALLVRTSDRVDNRFVEAVVLIRPRKYGRDVAQVFAVGVEKSYAALLASQVQLVGPEERRAHFGQLFGG